MPKQQSLTLVFSLGSSVSVITETLYALHEEYKQVPNTLYFITTNHGRDLLNEMRRNRRAVWEALCDKLQVFPDDLAIQSNHILVAEDPNGRPLADLQTAEDNLSYATLIHDTVKKLCQESETKVYACLAGGRKTMSAHLHSAMQLFGRPQDKIFHVLVNEPYDRIPNFFFPNQPLDDNFPLLLRGESVPHDSSDAAVTLIDIPFIQLGTLLRRTRAKNTDQSYNELIAEVGLLIKQASRTTFSAASLDLEKRSLYLNIHQNDFEVVLNPKEFQLPLFLGLLNQYKARIYPVLLADLHPYDEKHALGHEQTMFRLAFVLCEAILKNTEPKFLTSIDSNFSRHRSSLKSKIEEALSLGNYQIAWTEILDFNQKKNNKFFSSNQFKIYPLEFHSGEEQMRIFNRLIRPEDPDVDGFVTQACDEVRRARLQGLYPELAPDSLENFTEELVNFFAPLFQNTI
jgi:CRISPR-associated protein (TIGR02584 family)